MDRTSILNDYVTDMSAVEAHILAAVERQLASDDTARYPEAVSALTLVFMKDLTLALASGRHPYP